MNATDPSGGQVTLSLFSAPQGAILSGNTIRWTPTHNQARKQNDFTVQAISRGGLVVASFSITPTGTIRGTQIASYWINGLATQVPADLSVVTLNALVPNGNAGYVTYAGQGASDGTFSIPNVPADFYWLKLQPAIGGSSTYYRSNSNDLDLGYDVSGHPRTSTGLPAATTVTGNFNVTGMDPWTNPPIFTPSVSNSYSGLIGVSPEAAANFVIFTNDTSQLPSVPIISDGATSYNGQLTIVPRFLPIEASAGDNTYVLQTNTSYPSGSLLLSSSNWRIGQVTKVLGPLQLTIDSNTTTAEIDGQFAPTNPTSAHFNIKAAGFASAIAGTNPNASDGTFTGTRPILGPQFSAEVSATLTPTRYAPPQVVLSSTGSLGAGLTGVTLASVHSGGLIGDYDAGDMSFVNPFAASAQVVYSAELAAYVPLYQSGSTTFVGTGTTGYITTTAPTAAKPFDQPMGNVQSPLINGASLFQTTNVSQPVQLSWSVPTGLTPSGYEIRITGYSFPSTCADQPILGAFCVEVVSSARLFTTSTSVNLPSGLLQDGVQYVFTIHALADSATDFLRAPNRGSWNRAYSDVISKLITVGAVAPAPTAAPVRMNATDTPTIVLIVRDSNGDLRVASCKVESGASCVQ